MEILIGQVHGVTLVGASLLKDLRKPSEESKMDFKPRQSRCKGVYRNELLEYRNLPTPKELDVSYCGSGQNCLDA